MRGRRTLSRGELERGAMPGANYALSHELSFVERRADVGAGVVDGKILAAGSEHCDALAVRFHQHSLLGLELIHACYFDVVGHILTIVSNVQIPTCRAGLHRAFRSGKGGPR